jgi:hypothetical protein
MGNILKTIQAVQVAISEGTWPNSSVVADLAKFGAEEQELWVSKVDPLQLKPAEFKPAPSDTSGVELLAAESFLRFFGLEPSLSLTLKELARPACPECAALTNRRNKGEFLRSLKDRVSGFIVISMRVSDPILGGMPLGSVLDVLGSRSLIIGGRRISGGEIDKIAERSFSDIPNIAVILKTFSLPLSESDAQEILYEEQFCDNSAGAIEYSIVSTPTAELRPLPLNVEFECPNGHDLGEMRAVSVNAKKVSERFVGGIPLTLLGKQTLNVLRDALSAEPLGKELSTKLDVLVDAGFGDYLADDDFGGFSSGELLRALIGRFLLSSSPDSVLDITAASGLLAREEEESLKRTLGIRCNRIRFATRIGEGPKLCHGNAQMSCGPYHDSKYDSVELQLISPGINLIEGPTGVGKSFILNSLRVDPRIKREFAAIKFLPESSYDSSDFLIVTLGISRAIAEVFASTLDARALGLKWGDFDVSNPTKLCRECRKLSESYGIGECDVCNGSLLNGSAGSVSYKGYRMSDILGFSIAAAAELFSGFRELRKSLELAQLFGFSGSLLGDRLLEMTILRREMVAFIRFISELPQSSCLILLSNPFRTFSQEAFEGADDFVQKSSSLLKSLAEAGHTIVVTDNSGCLYEVAPNVIGLSRSRAENGSLHIGIKK